MAFGRPITNQNDYKASTVIATAGQTLFTVVGGYKLNKLSVFRNGVRLSHAYDFVAGDGSTVTLNNACQVDDEVTFEALDTFVASEVQSIIGIHSGGNLIGFTTTINFTGTGNTVTAQPSGVIDVSISGGARGGGGDKVFQENQRAVNTAYTLTPGYSAISVGPVSVSAGVTVTIPGTERWVIL
jgi:hypothetical protein